MIDVKQGSVQQNRLNNCLDPFMPVLKTLPVNCPIM